MLNMSSPVFLRRVLLLDAATCVATGALLALGADFLSALFALPVMLLREAGIVLFPVAAFIAFTATRKPLSPAMVWAVIGGNALWVAGSIGLLLSGWVAPSAIGQAFVVAQAVAVAVLAELEFFGLRKSGSHIMA
ncbi:MAG TPA: hypothetical protein VGE12_13480 [Noviherbaspirillum sp.]